MHVDKSVHKKENTMHAHYGLFRLNFPPLGDCLPQAFMIVTFNKTDSLLTEEERSLSRMK